MRGDQHHIKHKLTYKSWISMRQRCNNPNSEQYPRYGGRGIKVCRSWDTSFEQFLRDMGDRPSVQHTLGRINNNLGYTKKNCRWETSKQQANNKGNTRFITYRGETLPVSVWSSRLGITPSGLWRRLKSNSDAVAVTKPLYRKRLKLKFRGVTYPSANAFAKFLGVWVSDVVGWHRDGLTTNKMYELAQQPRRKNRKWTLKKLKRMQRLREQGWMLKEIGAKFNITVAQVHDLLQKAKK